MTASPDVPRLAPTPRRFLLACGLGALVGFVVVVLIMSATHVGPGTRHYSDDFFDAQARSWLSGRWDVPAEVVGGEGFATDKGMQIYFGVTPSLLRLPILAVTHLDGQLSVFSELLALGVLLAGAARLLWSAHALLSSPGRDPGADADGPPGWFPCSVAGLFLALVGACSSATFLAAQPTVFAEAILWSAALTIVSLDQLVRFLRVPTMRRALLAALFAGASFNTRITTGLGALVPLAVVVVLALLPAGSALHRRAGSFVPTPERLRRYAVPLAAAGVASLLVCFAANVARFGHPWKIPYEQQVVYRFDPDRLAVFQASSGPFSTAYIGNDVAMYWRPDGLRVTPFPLVTYPDPRDTYVVNAPPNIIESSASVPAAMPGLFLLSAVGLVTAVGRRRRARLTALRLAVLGAAVPAVFILNFASLAHRYTGDFLPLLVVLGAVGAARLIAVGPPRARVLTTAGLVLLTVWGAWVTVNLAMWTNEHNSIRNRTALESWVGALADLQARLPGGTPIAQPATPPAEGTGWDLVARPDCARVYTNYFNGWYAFERTPGTGAFHLRVAPPPDDRTTHAVTRSADGQLLVGLRNDGGTIDLEVSTTGGATWKPGSTIRGMRASGVSVPVALPVGDDGRVDLTVDYDWYLRTVTASGDSNDSFLLIREQLAGPEQHVEVDPAYPGTITDVAEPAPQCRRWTTG